MSVFSEGAALVFKKPFTQKIGKLEIDIVSQTGITEKVNLTSNPIEGGFNTDNARDEPTEIIITGLISSFSLKNSKIKQISSLAEGKIPNRLKDAHDELYSLKEKKEPITLIMKYKSYKDMFITRLDMTNSAGDGESFRFTITFQKVNIVKSELVLIKKDSAKKRNNYGRQSSGNKQPNVPPKVKPQTQTIGLGEFLKRLF